MNQSCSQERSNCNLKQQANLLSSCIPPKFELPKYAANCQFNGYEGKRTFINTHITQPIVLLSIHVALDVKQNLIIFVSYHHESD